MALSLGLNLGLIKNQNIFNPSQYGIVESWHDANDANTITHSSNSVSQWDDKSGNDNHLTQSDSGLQGTYGADANGGYVEFDGAGSVGTDAPNWMQYTSVINAKTIFLVIDYDQTNQSMILGKEQAGNSSYIFYINSGAYQVSLDGNIGDAGDWYVDGNFIANGGNIGTQGDIDSNARVQCVKFDSGDPSSGFDLLAAYLDTHKAGYGGKVREIISYNEYLSQSTIEEISARLITKWKIKYQRSLRAYGDSYVAGLGGAVEDFPEIVIDNMPREPASFTNRAVSGAKLEAQVLLIEADDLSDSALLIWDGHANGRTDGGGPVVDWIAEYESKIARVNTAKGDDNWFFILPIPIPADQSATYLQFIDGLSTALTATYGADNIYDPRDLLKSLDPSDTSVGGLPSSIFIDTFHLTAEAETAVAQAIASKVAAQLEEAL